MFVLVDQARIARNVASECCLCAARPRRDNASRDRRHHSHTVAAQVGIVEAPVHARGVVEQCSLHSLLLGRDAYFCGTGASDQRVHPTDHHDRRTLRLATRVISPLDHRRTRHRTCRRSPLLRRNDSRER